MQEIQKEGAAPAAPSSMEEAQKAMRASLTSVNDALNKELAELARRADESGFYIDIQKVLVGDRLVGRIPVAVPKGA